MVINLLVVHARVAPREGFQAVVEVIQNFAKRHFVAQLDAPPDVDHVLHDAALFDEQLHGAADVLLGQDHREFDVRLLDFGHAIHCRQQAWVLHREDRAIGQCHFVNYAWGCGDEIQVKLTLEPLLYDFGV